MLLSLAADVTGVAALLGHAAADLLIHGLAHRLLLRRAAVLLGHRAADRPVDLGAHLQHIIVTIISTDIYTLYCTDIYGDLHSVLH